MDAFREYLVAVIDHAFFWFGGFALVIIEGLKRIEKTKQWAERLNVRWFWAVAGLCFLIATFQAWNDERNLTLSRATYMAFTFDSVPPFPYPLFRSGQKSQINFNSNNDGNFLAENYFGMGGFVIRDIDHHWDVENDKILPTSPEVEHLVFEQFKRENSEKLKEPRARITLDPHAKLYLAAYTDSPLTDEQAIALRNGDKIMYFLAIAEWTDGAGTHEKRYCHIVRPPADDHVTAETCKTLNDFLPVAID